MTFEKFMASVDQTVPPVDISPALAALWWMQKDEWERAHSLINDRNESEAAWVHAHLHRVEGDMANANYWYRRARRRQSRSESSAKR